MNSSNFTALMSISLLLLLAFTTCRPKKIAQSNPSPEETILEKRWKLIELGGKPITPGSTQKEPYIRLRAENHRLEATGGCNGLGGTYELKENGRIRFSQIIGTQMACENMQVEHELIQVLQTADSYYIKGDSLQLIKARMAPLAKFEALYVQ